MEDRLPLDIVSAVLRGWGRIARCSHEGQEARVVSDGRSPEPALAVYVLADGVQVAEWGEYFGGWGLWLFPSDRDRGRLVERFFPQDLGLSCFRYYIFI